MCQFSKLQYIELESSSCPKCDLHAETDVLYRQNAQWPCFRYSCCSCLILRYYVNFFSCFSQTHGITRLVSVVRIVTAKRHLSASNATPKADNANVAQVLWEENVTGASLVTLGTQRMDVKVGVTCNLLLEII